MVQQLAHRRRAALGTALMVLGTIGLISAVPVSAGTSAPTQTPSPPPSLVPDNPTCGDLAPDGASWIELKVEPVVSGPASDGTLTVNLVVNDNEDTGPTFDWTSNIGVDAVFVKGGPDGNLYLYDPESTGDTGLHAPTNPQNGKFYGLSHVSFCYDQGDETTTTTSPETTTTTTTPESTTTTTAQPTTTSAAPPGPTTAPSVAPSVAPTPTPSAPRQLAFTGRNTPLLLVGSGVLLAAGLALLVASRRLGRT